MRQKDIKVFQNFYNKSTEIQRFKMCFYKGDDKFFSIEKADINNSYNYELLGKLLNDNELEAYSDLLVDYQNNLFEYFAIESSIYSLLDEINAINTKQFNYTKFLKFLYDNIESNWGVKVSLSNVNGKRVEIRDEYVTKAILNSIKALYFRLDMHRRPYTYNEAKEYLQNPSNLKELVINYNANHSTGKFENEHIDVENIPEILIQHLQNNFLNEKVITSSFINDRYEELNTSKDDNKPKSGRKIENSYFGELALDLSYLIRFQRFVLQDEFENIYDMPISVKDLQLIYNYFEFWGIENLKKIPKKEKMGNNKLKSGYMNVSAWIVKYKKSRGKLYCDIAPNLNEIEIDKYRKIVRCEIE